MFWKEEEKVEICLGFPQTNKPIISREPCVFSVAAN